MISLCLAGHIDKLENLMTKSKVLIVGGGFGGLNAAQALKNAPVEVLLIDKANYHLFQPLLYQVATAALSPGNIALPIREILARQSNATVLMAEVVKIDRDKNEVEVGNGDRFSYDYLILAPGTTPSYYGHSDWARNAPGLKTLYDALTIREKILLSFEHAERCDTLAEAEKYMCFVVVGGGPTGVEMAGAIAEIARKSLIRNFRHIKPEHSKIYLIEGEKEILPSYPVELSQKARSYLEHMGVHVLLNTRVTQVTDDGVRLGDKFLESTNVIWAAGERAAPVLQTLGVPLDRVGAVIVNPDLSIPGSPHVFVIGDSSYMQDDKGKPLPGIAPVAIQQGRYVARIIKKSIDLSQRQPFQYRDKGMMATIGKAKAVGVIGSWKISGFFAWLMWCLVHVAYLISFPNRFLVMTQWFFWYLTNQRRVRLIARPVNDDFQPNKT